MLRFFRINDPYRLIVIFFALLLVRLPMFISGDTLTIPELDYLLAGEKFDEGSRLYSEIWTKLGPLSTIFYGVMHLLFGRSQLALQILALIVVFGQSFIFNKILLMNKAFDESTYVPGIIYAILMSWFFDQYSLSPAVLGITFILLALNNILAHIEFRAKADEVILNIGIHIGVATLFYLPYAIFVPFVLLIFALYSGTVVRRYLLVLYGFALPIMLTAMVFMLTGRLSEFVLQYIMPSFGFESGTGFINWQTQLLIFSIPILFFLLGISTVIQRGRFTKFQANLSQIMVLWVLLGVVYIFLVGNVVPANLMIFVAPFTYFISLYFLNRRRKWLAEIIFLLFALASVMFNHGIVYHFSPVARFVDLSAYLIEITPEQQQLSGQRILVLGSDIRPYAGGAHCATPFLEWKLAAEVFENLEFYDNLSIIGEGIYRDPPSIIIDQEKLMPSLKEHIPAMREFQSRDGILYRRN